MAQPDKTWGYGVVYRDGSIDHGTAFALDLAVTACGKLMMIYGSKVYSWVVMERVGDQLARAVAVYCAAGVDATVSKLPEGP